MVSYKCPDRIRENYCKHPGQCSRECLVQRCLTVLNESETNPAYANWANQMLKLITNKNATTAFP
ncbi:hypothetical protein TUMEXPCC7403_19105 [Tumidithrix helvetica PCC 7403]